MRIAGILFCCLLYGLLQPAHAQNQSQQQEPVKVGLALSGGGAKGFAHIGVLKVLEKTDIQIDAISGTSMGSIVGGLYSLGYSADQLEDIALNNNWMKLFSRRSSYRHQTIYQKEYLDNNLLTLPFSEGSVHLPRGLVQGHNVAMLLYRLTLPYHSIQDFTKLPIPFAAVATNLATGEGVYLDHGYLPEVMRASIAIPTIFEPVKIDTSSYIDGGVARNIPASDVQRLGADIVITSDVSGPLSPVDSLNSFISIMQQAVGFQMEASNEHQLTLTDVHIRPDVKKYSSSDFDKAKKFIALGEKAAREMLPELKQLADSIRQEPRNERPNFSIADSVLINQVNIDGGNPYLRDRLKQSLQISIPSRQPTAELEKKLNKIYQTSSLKDLRYRLQKIPDHGGYALNIHISADTRQSVGISLRYDSQYKASLLFSGHFNQLFTPGDVLFANFRLGKQLKLQGSYILPLYFYPKTDFELKATATRTPIDLFNEEQRISSIDLERLSLFPHINISFLPNFRLAIGPQFELFNLNEAVGETFFLNNISGLITGKASIYANTFNRSNFPSKGQQFLFNAVFSDQLWGSAYSFTQFSVDWKNRLPITEKLSFMSRTTAGRTLPESSTVPLHYYFYSGGAFSTTIFSSHQFPLWGFKAQELSNKQMKALQLGAQYSFNNDLIAQIHWNAASLESDWNWTINTSDFQTGFGLSAGLRTFVGPVKLTLMTKDFNGPYALRINVGHSF